MAESALTGIAKVMVAAGVSLTLAGIVVYALGRWGVSWEGLPGDLSFRWGGTSVHLPLATSIVASILLSVLLTLGLYIAARFRH